MEVVTFWSWRRYTFTLINTQTQKTDDHKKDRAKWTALMTLPFIHSLPERAMPHISSPPQLNNQIRTSKGKDTSNPIPVRPLPPFHFHLIHRHKGPRRKKSVRLIKKRRQVSLGRNLHQCSRPYLISRHFISTKVSSTCGEAVKYKRREKKTVPNDLAFTNPSRISHKPFLPLVHTRFKPRQKPTTHHRREVAILQMKEKENRKWTVHRQCRFPTEYGY